MANQIQRVEYEGYLADDPEMRFTPSGAQVTNFRMGSNRQYKTAAGEQKKETTWLKVAVWGKLAEIVSMYCGKGAHVIVEGILRVGENGGPTVYQTNAGAYASSYEVTAREVRILDGKKTVGETTPEASPVGDEDIPF